VNDEDGLDAALAIIAEPFRNESGSTPCAPVSGTKSTSRPKRAAIARHSVAKWPVSNMSTRSPGDSVLTRAASHAPGARGGVDEHMATRFEDPLHALEHVAPESREFATSMVNGRPVDRP
jgi:hypothetical protein